MMSVNNMQIVRCSCSCFKLTYLSNTLPAKSSPGVKVKPSDLITKSNVSLMNNCQNAIVNNVKG